MIFSLFYVSINLDKFRTKETTIFCRKLSFLFGAGGGGRTRTVSLPPDFESGVHSKADEGAGGA